MNYSSCNISLWLVPGNFLLHTGSVWKKKQAAGSFFFFNPEFHKSSSYSESKIAV